MLCRLAALAIGFALDALFGDPLWMPHPVVAMGKAISLLEKGLRRLFPAGKRGQLAAGAVLAAVLPLLAFGFGFGLVRLAGLLHPLLGLAVEGFLCYQLLAAKALKQAGMLVYRALAAGDLAAARAAVGRVVGRDTGALSEGEVIRATVETVAENTSDGVVAPMLFFALGGAPLAMAYKAVNTMDSMVGYKNERYLYFGRAAARLDDAANYIPARLTALLMLAACGGGQRAARARAVWRRDRRNHQSPNAGHPEAACAGALGVQLGGGASYFGQRVEKPTLGEALRPLAAQDIPAACALMGRTALLCLGLCALGLGLAALIPTLTGGGL